MVGPLKVSFCVKRWMSSDYPADAYFYFSRGLDGDVKPSCCWTALLIFTLPFLRENVLRHLPCGTAVFSRKLSLRVRFMGK